MPRSYRHIKEYEKEILELKEQGMTLREIGKKYGIETINKLYALLLAKGLNDDVTKAIRDKTYCDYLLNKYRSALV